MKKGEKILVYSVVFVAGLFFLFMGLSYAGPFLVPVLTAMVMAFMMLPITNKLEKWGFKKIFATLTSTLILLIVAIGFLSLLFFQIRSFTDDWLEIQDTLEQRATDLADYLVEKTPLEEGHVERFGLRPQDIDNNNDQQQTPVEQNDQPESQNQGLENNNQQEQEGTPSEDENDKKEVEPEDELSTQAISVAGAVIGFIVNFIIVFIYVFLFIHFRARLKEFILRFFPHERRQEAASIVTNSSSVSRSYMVGRLLLMVSLAILYYIGLAISGLENALFIALLSAALSIIPFAGNIIGLLIAVAVSLLTDGGMGTILGITITFIVAQFVDTYILQPIVLGGKLDVHPIFIIMTVILGNEIWGIMGMVLAIPIFGIITVVCRQVPALNPFGYLFSNKDIAEPGDDSKIIVKE